VNDSKVVADIEQLCDKGFDGIPGVVITLFNKTMQLDRTPHYQANPDERSEERPG
jgi:hypothetical protein